MVAEVLDVPADDLLAFGREPVARDGFPEPRWRIVIERSEQNVEKELVDPSDDAGHRGVAAIEVLPPRLAKLACGALVVGDELAHLSETLVDVKPIYPEYLKASKVSGVVTMNAVIGTDGMVRVIDNLKGPDPGLENAAADAVRQWQFSPTLLNCQPIDVAMTVTVNFTVQP